MELMAPQHYIIRDKEGLIYYFYLNHNRQICYSLYKNNLLLKKENLINETIVDFSVTITLEDKIHLICITKSDKLMYYLGMDNHWSNSLISKVDTANNIYSYLLLLVRADYTHVLYIKTNVSSPDIATIQHIYWNQESMQRSTITTYMPGKYPSPFQVQIDKAENIHITYKVFHKNNHQLYYSKFNFINKKWLSTEIISDLKEDHSHPYMLIDNKDNLHLIWCTIANNNFILKYKRKANISNQRNKWSITKTLSSKNANYISPIIVQEGSFLKIFSRQNQYITEITSEDYGNKWILSPEDRLYKVKNPLLLRYITNFEIDKAVYNLNYIYGEISNKVTLLGMKLLEFNNNGNSLHLVPESFVSSSSDTNNNNVNNKGDLAVNDMKKIADEVHNYRNTLAVEFGTLDTVRALLQKKSLANSQNPYDHHELQEIYLRFKSIKKNIKSLEKEKNLLQNQFAEIQSKLTILDKKITVHKDEYLILKQQINELVKQNSSSIEKIKNLLIKI